MGTKYAIFGISIITFLMASGATFTGTPPLEAAHAQTPEFVTGLIDRPYYADYRDAEEAKKDWTRTLAVQQNGYTLHLDETSGYLYEIWDGYPEETVAYHVDYGYYIGDRTIQKYGGSLKCQVESCAGEDLPIEWFYDENGKVNRTTGFMDMPVENTAVEPTEGADFFGNPTFTIEPEIGTTQFQIPVESDGVEEAWQTAAQTTSITQNDGVYTFQTHVPYTWDDDNGKYTPYILSEGSDHIQVIQHNDVRFIINKDSCSLTIVQADEILVKSDSYNIRTATIGTDDWSHLAINDEPCTTEVQEWDASATIDNAIDYSIINTTILDPDDELIVPTKTGVVEGISIVITKENNEGVMEINYDMTGGQIKATAVFLNEFYPNNKFGFTQSVILTNPIITLNDQGHETDIDLSQMVGMNIGREQLEQNEDLVIESMKMFYNSGLGFPQLWNVNIGEIDGLPQINLDYANQNSTTYGDGVPIGEKLILDPQFEWSDLLAPYDSNPVATHRLWTATTTANPHTAFVGQDSYHTARMSQTGSSSPAYTTALTYDISRIPSNAIITAVGATSCTGDYNSLSYDSGMVTEYRSMGFDGRTSPSLTDYWSTIAGSVQYYSDLKPGETNWVDKTAGIAHGHGCGYPSWNTANMMKFNAQAVIDLQNIVQSGQGWFGMMWQPLGFPYAPSGTQIGEIYSQNTQLSATYYIPDTPPTVSTTQTSGSAIDVSWTEGTDLFSNTPFFASDDGNSGACYYTDTFNDQGTSYGCYEEAYYYKQIFGPETTNGVYENGLDFNFGQLNMAGSDIVGIENQNGRFWQWFCGERTGLESCDNNDGITVSFWMKPNVTDLGYNVNNYTLTGGSPGQKPPAGAAFAINCSWIDLSSYGSCSYYNGYKADYWCGRAPMGSYNTTVLYTFGLGYNCDWGYPHSSMHFNGAYTTENSVNWGDIGYQSGHTATSAGTWSPGNIASPGAWIHFLGTIDSAGNTSIYLDGRKQMLCTYSQAAGGGDLGDSQCARGALGLTDTMTPALDSAVKTSNQWGGSSGWAIGGVATHQYDWRGSIDELYIFNTVFTDQDDIHALANGASWAQQLPFANRPNYIHSSETSETPLQGFWKPFPQKEHLIRAYTFDGDTDNKFIFNEAIKSDPSPDNYTIFRADESEMDLTGAVPGSFSNNTCYDTPLNDSINLSGVVGCSGWTGGPNKITSTKTATVGEGVFWIDFSPTTNGAIGYIGLGQGTPTGSSATGYATATSMKYQWLMMGCSAIYENFPGSTAGGTEMTGWCAIPWHVDDIYRLLVDNDGTVHYYRQAQGVGEFILDFISPHKASGDYYFQAIGYSSNTGVSQLDFVVTDIVHEQIPNFENLISHFSYDGTNLDSIDRTRGFTPDNIVSGSSYHGDFEFDPDEGFGEASLFVGDQPASTNKSSSVHVFPASDFSFDYNEPFTVSTWVKSDTSIQYYWGSILHLGYLYNEASYGGWKLEAPYNNLQCGIDAHGTSNEGWHRTNAGTIFDNVWHMVTCVYDGAGDVTMFVDGEKVTTTNYPSSTKQTMGNNPISPSNPDHPLQIGDRGDGGARFGGWIDETMIFDVEFSDADVADLYLWDKDDMGLSDTNIVAGTTYSYLATMDSTLERDIGGQTKKITTGISNLSSITAASPPDQVTGLTGTDGSPPQIDWTTPNSSGAITGYKVYRDTVLHDTLGVVLTYQDTTSVTIGTTYAYTVSAFNAIGEGAQSASVSVIAATPPDAPTSVDATAVPNQINLTWVTPASDNGSAITGYKIFRTDNLVTPMATLGVVNLWNGDASGTIGVSYTYNVHAVNAMGDSPAGVSDTVVHGNVPAQVIVSSVAALLGLAIKIDWDAPVANGYAISSYVVESTVNGGTSWTSVGTPNALTLTHQSLTEANQYQYRVSAVNALGTGTPSAMTTPAVTAGDVPDAPSGHSATQGIAEIGLAWAEPDDHEYSIDEYRIYRSLTTGGTYTLLVDSLTGLTHTDTSLTVNQAYFYKIQAHNSLGWSADSTIISATAGDVPAQVTGLTSTAVAGSKIDLAWTAPSDNSNAITNYLVEHSDNNSTWTTKATVGNVTTYQAVYASGDNGTTKYWRVSATNGLGTGVVSASSNTLIGDVPGQVGGLTATAQSATEIDLSWNVPADNGYAITVYKVERSLDNSNWTTLTSTHTLTTYDDTGLTASTDYYYQITASNVLGIGTASTSVLEKTHGVPSDITDLALTIASTTQINLSWTAPTLNGYAFTNFEVFQSEDGTNYTSISTITNVSTVTLNVTGLNVNDLYYFKVKTTNGYGTSGDSNIENAPTLPTSPAATNATAVSDVAINVSWNQPTGDQHTSYKIERSLDDTNWTTIVGSTGNTNTSFSDTGLTGLTTYYYKVSTINASGTSVASPSGNAKTFGSPDAPTSLTATALIAIDIDLDWDAPTENNGAAVSGYKIERSTDNTNYAVIVADTGNTDTDYTDTDATLVTDTTYYYRVSAINSFGAGALSNVASVLAGDKPNQVTGLVVTSATTSTLDLDWVAPSDNGYAISGYKIEKSLDGTNFTVLVASNPDLDYTDTSLNTNQLYYYQVSAINVFATGDVSAVSSAPPLPTPPATLSLTVVTDVRIDLTWSNPTGAEETGFKIERSTDNTNWSTIVADTGSTALTYSNTGLTALTDYYYRVSTLNASGESSVGSVETAKTFGVTVAPTNLDAISLTSAQIKLDWEEPTVINGAAVSGYKIERSTDNVSYSVLVADTGNTDETYTDTGIAGTTYYYRVSAINTYGASPPSNVDSALATDVPAQTTNFTATAQAGNEIDLAWTAPSNGGSVITGYQIERSLDNTNWSDLVADTGNQLIAYTDINLTTNQTYYYRVSAINLVGTGTPSVVDSELAGDVPNQITVITATAQAGSEIVVAWTAPANNAYAITVYTIERSTDNTNWITDGTSATASFTSQSLTNGTTYYYKVTATNALGNSLVSATVNDKAGDSPSQVTGFTGVALDDTRIKLDWTTPADNSYSLSGYKIEQSLDNTNWSTVVANTNSSAVTYTVTGLTTVTDYYHRVSAINGLGEGATATAVLVTTMGVPDAITTLAGTAAVNSINTQRSDITLTWTAPTANGTPITAYNVQVSIDGTTWLNLPNVTTTSAIHSNTINDTDFSYRVYSVNAIGTSLVSNTGVVWSLPNVPTGLSADTTSLTQINVTWTVMDAVYTYDLEHSTDGTAWSTEADPATTPYNDTGLVTDTIHYYRIAATNPSGTSAFTTSVNTTTFHLPTPPQNLTVTPTTNNLLEANLDWDAPADDGGTPLLNYTVEKSVDQINWVPLVTNCPPATDCTLSYYVDGVLSTQNTYYWRVIAENSFGSDTTNGYSSIVTYTTPTPAQSPSNLTAVPSGTNNNSATLDWTAPVNTGTHGVSGYKIERQENNGAWSTLVSTTNTSTTFTDSTLAQSINYGYRVYTLTNNNTMVSSTTTNTVSLEMLDITFTIGVTAIGGSTIAIQPDVLYSDGSHPPTVTQIRIFENSAYETDVTNTPQLLTLNVTLGFDIMYAYTPVESTYFAIATLENGGTTQWTSNSVTITPTAPFTGDLTINEVREQDLPNAGANWSESELSLEIQPAGSDVIIRYQPEGSVVLNTTNGSCLANCPSIVGYASVTQAITHLQNWTWSDAPYTSSQIGLDANKDYYISVYIAPNFTPMSSAAMPNGYPPITVDGDLVQITCTTAQQAMGCQPGNIPTGYPSDIAIKSVASPNAPPSLGIDQLGNLFGMPLVFVFVIGLAAVFTSRSAQMGVIIIVACVGIMIYLNYITFDFAEGLNSTNATFALIVIIMVVGFFIGKRYS